MSAIQSPYGSGSLPGVYTVTEYGAKGDGTTDDTAAIQACVNACVTAGGGVVYLPPGTYAVSSTITVPQNSYTVAGSSPAIGQAGPVIFRGAGFRQDGYFANSKFATVVMAKALAGDMFSTAQGNGHVFSMVAFEDMSIYGNYPALGATQTSGNLIHIYAWQEGWIRNVEVLGAYADGIRAENNTGGQTINGSAPVIDTCRVEHCGPGAAGGSSYGNGITFIGVVMGTVVNCHVESCYDGVAILNLANQSTVMNCSLQSNYDCGINISGAECSAVGNWSGGNHTAGILVQGTSGNPAVRAVISGNEVIGNGYTGSSASPYGIWLDNTIECVVTGNRCSDGGLGYQQYGISEQGSSSNSNLVTGNNLLGNTVAAVDGPVGAASVFSGNLGYNPVGAETVAVPASGSATTAVQHDRTFYVTAASSGTTSIAISGGPTVTIPASALAAVTVPAGQTLTPTYTAAPTWVVEGL